MTDDKSKKQKQNKVEKQKDDKLKDARVLNVDSLRFD